MAEKTHQSPKPEQGARPQPGPSPSASTPAGTPGPGNGHDELAALEPAAQIEVLTQDNEQLRAEADGLRLRVAELDARVGELNEQVRHYASVYDRARSEFAGARDRMQREHERTMRRDQGKAVAGLLGVLDTLDRSLESVRAAPPGQAFVDGVQMIRQQFEQALTHLGLRRFDGKGEVFDPERHQAVTSISVADRALDGHVVQSLAAGALIGDEVVRPATVIVGRYSEPEAPAEPN